MFNLFKKKSGNNPEHEWNELGSKFAKEVNNMIEFGETHGWENWKGAEPEDKREHLTDEIIALLKKANKENKVAEFRQRFPPAHSPLIKYFQNKSQNLEQLHFIGNDKILFLTGTSYIKRQAYILDGDKIVTLDSNIDAIGKSPQGNIYAIARQNLITTTKEWEGEIVTTFQLNHTKDLGISEIVPFNDGLRLLLVTSEGIFILSGNSETMIHPVPDPEDEDWSPNLSMENATISHNNEFIVVGDQDVDHRILDKNLNEIGTIGPQSSYPHFCLFSKDDNQLITNSCHFYNGITIGVDTKLLHGIKVDAYTDSGPFTFIDEEMRVYQGISTSQYYILGDAYGYVRAIDKEGRKIWSHFVGSTISGLTISDDEQTLWIGSHSGMLHKLKLGKGHRDNHTIGNGNHYEEFRLIFWNGDGIMRW
jgi:hypothetical protein